MRISDIYLMLAEVKAALGDDSGARSLLATVHNRNFAGGADPDFNKYIADCGSVWDAVIQERAFEFLGEGVRRFDLIRTGGMKKLMYSPRISSTKPGMTVKPRRLKL